MTAQGGTSAPPLSSLSQNLGGWRMFRQGVLSRGGMDTFRLIWEVVLRPEGAKGVVLLPKRWMVERTHGWLPWCRRLNVDYERLPESSEAFIYIAMIRLMLRRLA